jgi:hypothetical protein
MAHFAFHSGTWKYVEGERKGQFPINDVLCPFNMLIPLTHKCWPNLTQSLLPVLIFLIDHFPIESTKMENGLILREIGRGNIYVLALSSPPLSPHLFSFP